MAGPHRLAEAYVNSDAGRRHNLADMLKDLEKWHPYLKQLQGRQPRGNIGLDWLESIEKVNGTEVFVVEFTGEPGDAILCHPSMWHSASVNASKFPRIMRRTNVRRLRK